MKSSWITKLHAIHESETKKTMNIRRHMIRTRDIVRKAGNHINYSI